MQAPQQRRKRGFKQELEKGKNKGEKMLRHIVPSGENAMGIIIANVF